MPDNGSMEMGQEYKETRRNLAVDTSKEPRLNLVFYCGKHSLIIQIKSLERPGDNFLIEKFIIHE